MNRRQMLKWSGLAAAGAIASPGLTTVAQQADKPSRKRMGLTMAALGNRSRASGFGDPTEVLRYCHSLGAGGVQIGVGRWQEAMAGKVREVRESLDMFLEGQVRLPRERADVAAFEEDVRMGKEAGATIFRAVMLGGRRYETFRDLEAWRAFEKQSWTSLTLAEPIVRRHGVLLAIENHKDWRISEMVGLMEQISSEHVGVTLDTGNSISLLEDPMATLEGLAPYTVTTHFKDMGVQFYEQGFLLSEVPFGDGFVDLNRIVTVLEKQRPSVRYNLEMITRDPLKVPVLEDQYWVTMGDLRALELARHLRLLMTRKSQKELPKTEGLSAEERARFEERCNKACFDYWKRHLGV